MLLAALNALFRPKELDATPSRYLPETLCAELPGFDLLEEEGMITVKNRSTGQEKKINPYQEMKDLLEYDELIEDRDAQELRELCGFFSFTVQEVDALEGDTVQAFIDALYKRARVETVEDYLFSDEALQLITARRERFCAEVR